MFREGLNNLAEPYRELIKLLLESLKKVLGGRLISLAVFGSVARGEARADSDVDLLVIAEGLPRSRAGRVKLFETAEDFLEDYLEKLRDEGIHTYFSPIIMTPEEARKIPPIFLDMVEDAVIIYDKEGFFTSLLKKLASKLRELGAERVRVGRKWYWRLKKDFRFGEVIVIE